MNAKLGVHGMSFREIYDSHFSFVWRNLRRLGVQPMAIEDAAQDVFLVVYRRLDSFDPDRAKIETWLFGILLRVAKNHQRAARRLWQAIHPVEFEKVDYVSPDQGPAEQVACREAARILDALLAGLKEDLRTIFVLVEMEGLSVPDAAEVLQCNVNTAYWRLRSARISFRRSLARLRKDETQAGETL